MTTPVNYSAVSGVEIDINQDTYIVYHSKVDTLWATAPFKHFKLGKQIKDGVEVVSWYVPDSVDADITHAFVSKLDNATKG